MDPTATDPVADPDPVIAAIGEVSDLVQRACAILAAQRAVLDRVPGKRPPTVRRGGDDHARNMAWVTRAAPAIAAVVGFEAGAIERGLARVRALVLLSAVTTNLAVVVAAMAAGERGWAWTRALRVYHVARKVPHDGEVGAQVDDMESFLRKGPSRGPAGNTPAA